MPKNQNQEKISPETQLEAMKIAKATQRPGQTKEQTKLVAQGIEKGINHYKKQQKAKSRAQNKKAHKASAQKNQVQQGLPEKSDKNPKQHPIKSKQTTLPWILLLLSWAGFAAYLIQGKSL